MRWHRVAIWFGISLALACVDKDGMGNEGSETGGSGSGEEGGDGDCREDDFGTVMIELSRSAAEPSDPFVGTAYIVTFLDYKECLVEFYVNDHTEYQQEGVQGAGVFDAWGDGCLCDASYDKPIIECSVSDVTQTLNTQGAQDIAFMAVEYAVTNDDLEGTHIPFGPLPTESLAGCSPLVQLRAASVQGFDANNEQIWRIASFDNATARVGQGAAIQVFVERVN
jgi:hypothetical protein